eukprot:364103-Chlamydomonas_euryale.AAC.2
MTHGKDCQLANWLVACSALAWTHRQQPPDGTLHCNPDSDSSGWHTRGRPGDEHPDEHPDETKVWSACLGTDHMYMPRASRRWARVQRPPG